MIIKRLSLLAAGVGVIVSSVFFLNEPQKESYFPRSETPFGKEARLNAGYVEYMNSIQANRTTGFVSTKEINDAVTHATKMQRSNKNLNINWNFKGPNNVGGRTRAILIDRLDTMHIYAGGISGGLWESDDAGLTWRPYDDDFEILNVSSIAQGSDGRIYVGTGSSFELDPRSVNNANASTSRSVGTGLYVLTGDGGSTRLVGPAISFNFGVEWATINRVAVDPNDPNRIYVAMNQGIRESTDGGQSWRNPLGNIFNGSANDIQISDNGRIYASFNDAIIVSDDYFAAGSLSVNRFSGAGRIALAIAPSDDEIAYASIARAQSGGSELSECLLGVYRTVDGGETWQVLLNTPDYFEVGGIQCQGVYDNAIAVYPDNPGKIAVGGIRLFQWNQSSVNPAPPEGEWVSIASIMGSNNESSPDFVHADIHQIVFHPTNPNKVYIGSDGGIGHSRNFDSPEPTYTQNNLGYNITQFYDIGVGPNDQIIGGTQDNGTQLLGLTGFNTRLSSVEVAGGDGFDSELFSINPTLGLVTSFRGALFRAQGIGTSVSTTDTDNNIVPIVSGRLADLCAGAGCSNTFYTNTSKWESFNHTETNDSVVVLIDSTELFPIAAGSSISYESKNNNIQIVEDSLAFDLFPFNISFARPVELEVNTLDIESSGMVSFVNAFDTITVDTNTRTIQFNFFEAPAQMVSFDFGVPVEYENVFYNRTSVVPTAPPLTITVFGGDSARVSYIDPKIVFNYRIELPDVVQSMVALTNVRGAGVFDGDLREIWMSRDVLKGGNVEEPRWVKIAGAASTEKGPNSVSTPVGDVTICSAFSPCGNYFFYGTTGGDLYRVDSLNSIDFSLFFESPRSEDALINAYDSENALYGSTSNRLIASFGNRAVTSIAINPRNSDSVIVTLGNYGSAEYVQRSANATADVRSVIFENISGEEADALPSAPVYEAIIDVNDSTGNTVLVATEIGVYGTTNAFDTINPVVWTNESRGMGRARVLSLSQAVFDEQAGAINQGVVYAGTHGRGVYETGDFVVVGIEENPSSFDNNKTKKDELKVYPNPVVDNLLVELSLATNEVVNIEVYSITGKLAYKELITNTSVGLNTVGLQLGDLPKGTYIIRALQLGRATTAKFVKQ